MYLRMLPNGSKFFFFLDAHNDFEHGSFEIYENGLISDRVT